METITKYKSISDKDLLNKFPVNSLVRVIGCGWINSHEHFRVTGYTVNPYKESILMLRGITVVCKPFKIHPNNVERVLPGVCSLVTQAYRVASDKVFKRRYLGYNLGQGYGVDLQGRVFQEVINL